MTWKVQEQLQIRRNKVLELLSRGLSQSDIANRLGVHESTISRDIAYLREKARENIKNYLQDKLPLEFESCLIALNGVRKQAWELAQQSENDRVRLQALNLAKDTVTASLDALTNAGVVDNAIKFAEENRNEGGA